MLKISLLVWSHNFSSIIDRFGSWKLVARNEEED
jgi:hypothetical protein